VDRRIERAYYDRDLRAVDAVADLYSRGVSVTRIQRSFSLGMFGTGGRRKLVPTRWSITAVDDGLSLQILDKVKQFETIDEYRVYVFRNLDNIFAAILSPEKWKFEWIEAWFPGTTWNEVGSSPVLMGDHEPYWGRKTYAAVGGCYYSARLAVCEQLVKERRQATVIVLREARPGYIMPVGVWQVRENVRNAMRQKPNLFKNLSESLRFISGRFEIPLQRWILQSELLKNALFQKRITDFFSNNARAQ